MENDLKLSGKKYIVTGASSGIGREICRELSGMGATIILVARNESKLKECMCELDGNNHRYYCFDLKNIEDIEGLIKTIVEENGKLDGFVHSAGVGPTRPLKNTKYDFVQDVFKINTFAFLEILRVFSLKKYNTGSGAVVGISSARSIFTAKGVSVYSASKAAMDTIVKVAAEELSEKNIRVNSVQPTWVHTDILSEYLKNVDSNNSEELSIVKNALKPSEIANVVSFLLSDLASGISGEAVLIGTGRK